MNFSIRLNADLVSVEAGVTFPVEIEVVSRGEEDDQYELVIEGLDPEWTAVPVPTFSVRKQETHSEKFFLKPGRVSESLAGNYPFVVKVRSLTSGEQMSVQGVLQIKAYHHLTMEISPKKGTVSPSKKQNSFTVTILNLGNTEHTVQLYSYDTDDKCAFQFEQDQVVVAAGQQRSVSVRVNPERSAFIGSSKLHGFSIMGRSIETPSVVCSSQAQLEQRPFLSTGTLLALILFSIVAYFWVLLTPKQPTIELGLSSDKIMKGESLTVSWRALNAKKVRIVFGGSKVIYEGSSLSGQRNLAPAVSGTVEAIALRDSRQSNTSSAEVQVENMVEAPDPKILSFDVVPLNPKVGQTLTIRYKFNDAVTKATLAPSGMQLDPKAGSIQVKAEDGEMSFWVVAQNVDGKTIKSKAVNLKTEKVSAVSFVVFRLSPAALPSGGGKTTLTWQLENAVRAELTVGDQTTQLSSMAGDMELDIPSTTTITITGYDKVGLTVMQKRLIKVKEPDLPDSSAGGDQASPSTTGGGL